MTRFMEKLQPLKEDVTKLKEKLQPMTEDICKMKEKLHSARIHDWLHSWEPTTIAAAAATSPTLIARSFGSDIWMDFCRQHRQQTVGSTNSSFSGHGGLTCSCDAASSTETDSMGHSLDVSDAIWTGNQEEILHLLSETPSLISRHDEKGWTLLSYAAYYGNLAIVDFLLKHYPNSVSTRNEDKDSSLPVHKACQGGHIEVLERLYSHLRDSFKWTDKRGQTILHLAAKEPQNKLKDMVFYLLNLNHQEITIFLIGKIDERSKTPLDLANDKNNLEVAELINVKMHWLRATNCIEGNFGCLSNSARI